MGCRPVRPRPFDREGVLFEEAVLSVQQKIDLFRACFSGLPYAYGTYDLSSGAVRQVKQLVSDRVLLDHLRGAQPYGAYLLVQNRTRAVVADFDSDDVSLPLAFMERARQIQIPAYIERSKRKGWHVWVFLAIPGVEAACARRIMTELLDEVGAARTEIFPKQDELGARNRFGNFINTPLFGGLVPLGRTVFVDPATLEPYPDQWELLAAVQRVDESQLRRTAERISTGRRTPILTDAVPLATTSPRTFGLAPCAQRMLSEGVKENQRVACFRLAVHLKKSGLPWDITVAALRAWARKNQPADGKRTLTDGEINEQVNAAYGKNYRGCGCEEPAVRRFCDPSCPLRCNSGFKKSRDSDGQTLSGAR